MPSLLKYEIITDPTWLQASLPGEPSRATVYIIVSNSHQSAVEWDYIDVELPFLSFSSPLTDDPAAVTTSIERTKQRPIDDQLEFGWDNGRLLFRAQFDQAQPHAARYPFLKSGEALVLKLENIPVAGEAGLSLLEIHEKAGGGDRNEPMRLQPFTTTLGLVKQTPNVPRNFRAEKSLLDGDRNEPLVLKWDGPNTLDYRILDATGAEVRHEPAAQGGAAAHQEYSWSTTAPKRGATYTLVAKSPDGGDQRGYFLTTTVHALVPEFGDGTRSPWIEGTQYKGRAVFTPDGLAVRDAKHDLGRVTADKADVDRVITRLVQGRSNDDGWITFPDRGVNVYHGPTNVPGVVTAARADVDGVNTKWAGSRDAGAGWIEFTSLGAGLHKDGTQELGTLTADRADVNGVDTKWVGDRDGGGGWLEFPRSGIDVRKDGGQEWGTVAADRADLNGINTKWVQGRATTDGWIEFPASGVRVLRDGGHDLGTVTADKADLNELHTGEARVSGEARVTGHLTVGGGMKLSHDGERMFFTMPDRIMFQGINEFKKWVTFGDGISVSFGRSNVSMTRANGMIVGGSDLQIQNGKLSISTGNPPHVREL
ncbi:hypothetical protein [Kitasatospora sp. NPDC056181]|uniref:hypothetical protein n=1 Tax=Kitasatospora sp. NPDC056181 TaxID=3345737 RepID=UPI0035E1B1B3